jgi:hypothetical protein
MLLMISFSDILLIVNVATMDLISVFSSNINLDTLQLIHIVKMKICLVQLSV